MKGRKVTFYRTYLYRSTLTRSRQKIICTHIIAHTFKKSTLNHKSLHNILKIQEIDSRVIGAIKAKDGAIKNLGSHRKQENRKKHGLLKKEKAVNVPKLEKIFFRSSQTTRMHENVVNFFHKTVHQKFGREKCLCDQTHKDP